MDTHDTPATAATESASSTQQALPTVEYAGFWIRFLASVLDTLVLMLVIVPLLLVFYDAGDLLLAGQQSPGLAYELIVRVLPVIAVIIFWRYRSATPGKIMMDIAIVDADTFGQPTFGRLLLRYLGYYASILPLCLGFFWIGWDKRKQGFHDKIAKTVVIKGKPPVMMARDMDPAPLAQQDDTGMSVPDIDAPPASGRDPWKE